MLVSVRAPVGDVNVAEEQCCIGRGVAAIREKNGHQSFAVHAMKALGDRFARFDSEGTVFGSINKKDFGAMHHVLPTPEAIADFEHVVKPLDDMLSTREAESRTLAALRDALLPRLLSGELPAPADGGGPESAEATVRG